MGVNDKVFLTHKKEIILFKYIFFHNAPFPWALESEWLKCLMQSPACCCTVRFPVSSKTTEKNGGVCISLSIQELNCIPRRKFWKHLVLFCQFPYRENAKLNFVGMLCSLCINLILSLLLKAADR